MNAETKLERYYSPEKMRNCLFRMEQFFAIWQDESVDEQHRKVANGLFEHYRRLAICILTKEFDAKMAIDRVLTPEFIDTILDPKNNPYLV